MELLQNPEDRGYPIEYLLSRIRGRRAHLIRDWNALVYEGMLLDFLGTTQYRGFVRDRTPEGVWRNLLNEFGWSYAQMNRQLREIFRPFFFYTELRTVFICLRHLKENKPAGPAVIDKLLSVSLLSDELKAILKTSADPGEGIVNLERVLVSFSGTFRGLAEVFEAEGLRGAEQRLTNACLVYIMTAKPHPVMKAFFMRIIDSRNILNMYKAVRLNAKALPVYIDGGSILQQQFNDILNKGDLFAVVSLIRQMTKMKIDAPDMTLVEIAVYRWITRFLKKEGRDPLGIGLILDYLWRCSLEVMNLSVLLHGKELERETVATELVL